MQEMKDLLREGSENGRTKTRAEKRTTRQIENKIQKYKEKLKELSQGRKDDTIYFDDLEWIASLSMRPTHTRHGHRHKDGEHRRYQHPRVQRAQRILAKIEFMQETHNGAGVIFTTATPITNTLGEQFVMTRYLARDILNKCAINNFDDWAANFAEPVTRMEYATDGVTIKPKTALANYVNVPELQSIWSSLPT